MRPPPPPEQGLTNATLNLAWFVTYWVVFFLTALLVTAVTVWNMFAGSNVFIIFMLFWLFGVASTQLCFLLRYALLKQTADTTDSSSIN